MRVAWQAACVLFLGQLCTATVAWTAAGAADLYFPTRLDISLATLQQALGKVAGPVSFAPRPGSPQGTQEARLVGNVGMVQAAGEPGNLATVVLWLPVDAQGKLGGGEARRYLVAFIQLFTPDSEAVVLWVEQVLSRAVGGARQTPHLEALLCAGHQFKVMYLPTLVPAMGSLTVTAASGEDDQSTGCIGKRTTLRRINHQPSEGVFTFAFGL